MNDQTDKNTNIRSSLGTPSRLSGSQSSQKKNPPRLVITKLVLENFKSYAGTNILFYFSFVSLVVTKSLKHFEEQTFLIPLFHFRSSRSWTISSLLLSRGWSQWQWKVKCY
jgi:hypothetical protein